jgi:SPW repeat
MAPHDLPEAHPPLAQRTETNTAYPDTTYADETSGATTARDSRTATVIRAASAVEVLVGVWLACSPWLVGSGGSSVLRWNDVVIGAVLAVLAAPRFVRPTLRRAPSVSFGLGAWTIVAAFVLSFQNGATGTAPLWNAIACGAALTTAAAWSTTEAERATLRRG